jgi:outer membrane protein TolC
MRALVAGVALAAAVGLGLPGAAGAAAPQQLDLSGAVRYALAHDPAVLARRATLAQNESTYARDHAAEFPAVSGSLQNQVAKSNGNNGGSFTQFGLSQAQVFSQNTAQIGATYNLYNGSLNQVQAQQAKRQVEGARYDERRAEQQLAGDVAAAWYAAVQRRDALRLAEGDRAYQLQLLEAARAQERVGRVAGVDVLRAQVNELRSESNLTSARADDANARESLAQRIGAPPETSFALPAELPEPPLPAASADSLVAAALGARADVASARAQVAVARLADAAIETDRRPQLQLSGAFGNTESPTTQTIGLLGTSFGQIARPGFWQFGATESFTLPFIEYGARRAAHRAARAQIDAAQASLDSAESGVATDVRQALRGAQTASANLATAREAQRLGAESARIAQVQYRNGLISLTDATSAQQSALQAATDLVAARVTYLNALVRLRVAVGVADPLAVVQPGAP